MSKTDALKPGDVPRFLQRIPWIGADLQSIAYEILARRLDRTRWPSERIELETNDGSDDRLVHFLHLPDRDKREQLARPTVVMIHGLGGTADAGYQWLAACHLLKQGFAVIRYNRRGCGQGADAAKHVAWHGDTAGLAATTRWVAANADTLDLPSSKIVMLGFSLGGNTLAQWLAEEAQAKRDDRPEVCAAATISAPIDLKAATRRLDQWRNLLYRPYLLAKLRAEALRDSAELNETQRNAAKTCKSMWDFGGKFNGPRLGFETGEAYFDAAHLGQRLCKIDVPMLMIHSRDDPWVPYAMYDDHDWEACRNITTLLPRRGGHMGFHSRGSTTQWSIRYIARFFSRHCETSEVKPG